MTAAALANDDRLPHDRAVWRDFDPDQTPNGTDGKPVCIGYGGSQIVQTWGDRANWRGAKRWRFGWPPC